MSAQEMNVLLKEQGYLEGSPGAYRLTEKGEQYGGYKDWEGGNRNSLSYYTAWTTTSWDEEILPELRRGMASSDGPAAAGDAAPVEAPVEEAAGAEDLAADDDFDYSSPDDDDPPLPPLWVIAAVVGGIAVDRTRTSGDGCVRPRSHGR